MNLKEYIVVIFFLVAILLTGKLYSQDLPQFRIGDIPPGKSLTVKYDVIIRNPLPEGVTEISNQVLIKGENMIDIVSDDPATETPADPTIVTMVSNSPPTLAGTLPDQTISDNANIAPFATVSIQDVDLPIQDLIVTVCLNESTKGSFSTPSSFVDVGEGVYRFKGTALAATAAIRNLIFTPDKDRLPPGLTEKITFTIVVTDSAGETTRDGVTSVVVTSIDDFSVVAGGNATPVVDDNTPISPFADVIVTDADIQPLWAEVEILDGLSSGDLSPESAANWVRTIRGQNIVYSCLFNNKAINDRDVEAAIQSLVFVPRTNAIAPQSTEITSFRIGVAERPDLPKNILTLSLLIRSVNDAPDIVGGLTNRISLAENLKTANTIVADDRDFSPVLSYSIVGGNDAKKFQIDFNTGKLCFVVAPDFENPVDLNADNTYEVVVRVSDGIDFCEQTLSILILDVNDSTPLIAAHQSFNVDENVPGGTVIGVVSARDQDETNTVLRDWKIIAGNMGEAFYIDPSTGQLTLNRGLELDAEHISIYALTLTVSDGLNISMPETVTVRIDDSNDVVPVIADNQVFNVDENSAEGAFVGKVAASDGDLTITTFQDWTIIAGNMGNLFAIDSSTGELRVNDEGLDYELVSSFSLTILVSDGVNKCLPKKVNIRLEDENDVAPIIAENQSFRIDENAPEGASLGKVIATDGDSLNTSFQSWAIISGNTGNAFAIDALSGELTINRNAALDFELASAYILSLTVSDGANRSCVEDVTIGLNDLNDVAPVVLAGQIFSVKENAANGTRLGKITAVDGDIRQTTYSAWSIVAGNPGNAFAVDSLTGELTVKRSIELDAENVRNCVLSLTVSDGLNTSIEEIVTVVVEDVNDCSPFITLGQEFVVEENFMVGAKVGSVVATDGDIHPTSFQDWIISSGDPYQAFYIESRTGSILVNTTKLDVRTKNTYELIVQVSDGAHISAPVKVIIRLQNKLETIKTINYSPELLYENQPSASLVGNLTAISDNPNDTFTYQLVAGAGDSDNHLFFITGNEVRTSSKLDFEQKPICSIRVKSISQYGFSFEKELLVPIMDINESPTLDTIADQVICQSLDEQVIKLSGLSPGEDFGQRVSVSANSSNDLFDHLIVEIDELRYQLKSGAVGVATITLEVIDDGGRDNGGNDRISRSFIISVGSPPEVTIISDRGTSFDKGLESKLIASGGVNYQWMDAHGIVSGQNTSTLTIRPFETTNYRVRVTNIYGCSSVQDVMINVSDNYRIIEATTILSPNGDGVNDKFKVQNLDVYPNNEVKIYDRAGRMLYKKRNYTNDWDGTFDGSPLAEDTYFYIIIFGPKISPIKGFITIIRDY